MTSKTIERVRRKRPVVEQKVRKSGAGPKGTRHLRIKLDFAIIASIERVRDAELKKNKVEAAAYRVERAAYLKQVAEITTDFVPPTDRWRGRDIGEWITNGLPPEPVSPNDERCIRSKYDGLIAQLKLWAEPKVRLGVEDFRKFMLGDASACVC